MNQYIYYTLWVAGAVLIAVVHMSFVLTYPQMSHYVALPLIVIATLQLLRRPRQALVYAAFTGYILDLYSALPFGVITISLLAMDNMYGMLRKRVFKNIALHAVFLNTSIAIIVYYSIFGLLLWLILQSGLSSFTFPGITVLSFIHDAVATIVGTLLIMTGMFFVLRRYSLLPQY